jgi:hypothetical protein
VAPKITLRTTPTAEQAARAVEIGVRFQATPILKMPSSKNIVVGQTPLAGDDVPLGTTVTIDLAPKELLPTQAFATNKFTSAMWPAVGALMAAVPVAVGPVLTAKPKVTELPTDAAVTAFFEPATFSKVQGGTPTAADLVAIYNDVAFIFAL